MMEGMAPRRASGAAPETSGAAAHVWVRTIIGWHVAFWLMTGLVLTCLLWLHLVVIDLRRQRTRQRASTGIAPLAAR